MADLGTSTNWGTVEPIASNELRFCISCGDSVTHENDSGWERFTEDGRTTQVVCKCCDRDLPIAEKSA